MYTSIVNRTSQFFSVCSLDDLVKSITPQQKKIAAIVAAAVTALALGWFLWKCWDNKAKKGAEGAAPVTDAAKPALKNDAAANDKDKKDEKKA